MTSTNINVGRQLLVALISNNEPEFVRVLDAACLQIRGNRLDTVAEINRVMAQVRESESALGLDFDLATRKMISLAMTERLAPKTEALLAA